MRLIIDVQVTCKPEPLAQSAFSTVMIGAAALATPSEAAVPAANAAAATIGVATTSPTEHQPALSLRRRETYGRWSSGRLAKCSSEPDERISRCGNEWRYAESLVHRAPGKQ
jgi:hypothetical protein